MTVSRFTRRETNDDVLPFKLEDIPASGRSGDTVAAALLAHDGDPTRRTGVSGTPRTSFCMMGVCFDCLVTIDDVPNQQACMIELTAGMDIRRQSGFRTLDSET